MKEYKKIGSFFINSNKILVSDLSQLNHNNDIVVDNVVNGLWCSIVWQNHKFFNTINLELISVHSLHEGIIYSNLLMNNPSSWMLVQQSSNSEFISHVDYDQCPLDNNLDKLYKTANLSNILGKSGCVVVAGDQQEKKKFKNNFSTYVLVDVNNPNKEIIAVKTTFY